MKSETANVTALLVEDDPLLRGVVAQIIREHFPNLEVVEAGDSDAALQQVIQHRPQVAFVDIGIPGKNGILLTRDIKSSDRRVRVAMLSAHDTPEYREAALREGADCYICKGADDAHALILDHVARCAGPVTATG
jgi:DNA-binding NarL/FixJ family response regulator